jgi:hypothetical protein
MMMEILKDTMFEVATEHHLEVAKLPAPINMF